MQIRDIPTDGFHTDWPFIIGGCGNGLKVRWQFVGDMSCIQTDLNLLDLKDGWPLDRLASDLNFGDGPVLHFGQDLIGLLADQDRIF